MPYDQGLAQRLGEALGEEPAISEKKMFGGVAFLYSGNLCCGVIQNALVVRVGPAAYPTALGRPHARPFDFTGRPMTGWVLVEPGGYESDADLTDWIEAGVRFARSLPPKAGAEAALPVAGRPRAAGAAAGADRPARLRSGRSHSRV